MADNSVGVHVSVADACFVCGRGAEEGEEIHLYEVPGAAGAVPRFDARGRLSYSDVRLAWAHRGHLG